MFQSGFLDITLTCKVLIFINKNLLDLSQINLELHTHKVNKDFMLLSYDKLVSSSPLNTPTSSTCAYKIIVNIVTKNKALYQ